MPICHQLDLEHQHYAVWKITESLEELIALLEKINHKVCKRVCDETGVPLN